jgi:hypothetical protein
MNIREKREEKMKVNDIVMKMEVDFGRESNMSRGMSYEDYANKWVNDMSKVVIEHTVETDNDANMSIQLHKIKQSEFHYRIKGARIFNWFHANYPLWIEVSKGFKDAKTGKSSYTKIEGGPLWLDILENEMSPEFILQSYNKSVDHITTHDEIAIDLDNLIAYFNHTKKTYDNGHGQSKFFRYAFEALTIIKLAKGYNKVSTCPYTGKETHYIPQHYEFSSFGRKYYKGNVRLQSYNEMVRHASLGECYALDINASVYAYYRDLAKSKGIDPKITAVINVIVEEKDVTRELLADTLTNTKATQEEKIKIVKKALTAMGFGARIDNDRGVTKDIIFDKDDRKAFLSHEIVKDLNVFYQTLSASIRASLDLKKNAAEHARLKAMPSLVTHVVLNHKLSDKYDPEKPTTEFDRFKMPSVMAYMYQQEETLIMQTVMNALKQYGNETLLWVHDGIYVKKRADMQLINHVLKDLSTLTFSCQEVIEWSRHHKDDELKVYAYA